MRMVWFHFKRILKKKELIDFSKELKFINYTIKWKWAFRYQWIISKYECKIHTVTKQLPKYSRTTEEIIPFLDADKKNVSSEKVKNI
jgi:hypothetical protein